VNKAELIAAAREQWAKTEDAVAEAAKGNYEAKVEGQWSAKETFCHVLLNAYGLGQVVDNVLNDRPLAVHPGDEKGIEMFGSLSPKTLRIDLNTAHGTGWMALQKLTDEDLAREVDLGPVGKMPFGGLLQLLCVSHEQAHVDQALKAAGLVPA
jgi:hypothetical protein